MKKLLRYLGLALLAVIVVLGGVVAFLAVKSPDMRPPFTESVERTPERVERGRYLVEHVADCLVCHSEVMGDRFGSLARE